MPGGFADIAPITARAQKLVHHTCTEPTRDRIITKHCNNNNNNNDNDNDNRPYLVRVALNSKSENLWPSFPDVMFPFAVDIKRTLYIQLCTV